MKPIRFLSPTFPPSELIAADYAAILARGIFTNSGPLERELVGAIEAWIGQGVHASVVSNCTMGLKIAVDALFRKSRPLALISSFTFAAGPLALASAGFTPLFIDIDPLSWQPDLLSAMSCLRERHEEIGGIILPATFGVANSEIGKWEDLAAAYDLPLIIDAAAGFGAEYESGEPLGARGHCEVFSMHATKMLSVGEGGIITSRDAALIAEIDRAKNFGFDEQRTSKILGTNAKLGELNAAIGLRQIEVFAHRLEKRRNVLSRYVRSLACLGLIFQPGALSSAPAFASTLLPESLNNRRVIERLQTAQIECRDYYNPPVHQHPVFAASPTSGSLPVTRAFSSRIIALPMADDLDDEAVAHILGVLSDSFQ